MRQSCGASGQATVLSDLEDHLKLEDMNSYVTLAGTSIAADGRIVFGSKQMNVDEDRYDAFIWVADGEVVRKLTAGPTDLAPRFSPDGTKVAFLRKGPAVTDKPQLAVIPFGGGEAEVLTEFAMGVRSFDWSPDSARLVVSAVEYSDEWKDLDDDERKRKPARVVRLPMRFDTIGQLHNTLNTTWLVSADGSEKVKISDNDSFREAGAIFSPDGTKVAFCSDRSGDRVANNDVQVWERQIETGQLTMAADLGMWSSLDYSDSGSLHALGIRNLFDWPDMVQLWRLDAAGPVTLTPDLDRGIAELAFRGDDAVILIEDEGRVVVKSISPEGAITDIHEADSMAGSLSASVAGLAFVDSSYDSPGELMTSDGGAAKRRTSFNDDFASKLVHAEHFLVNAGGGDVDVWVYLPVGSEPVPTLLNIHGGPAAQYGYGFFDEFQVYVGAGYGVVACNPRGSSGRGSDHVRAVVGGGWGVNDMADIQAALDEALKRYPRLDRDRLGVMGGSYGGFMTAWLTSRDQRFKSAIVERGLLNWSSFAGTSDIGPYFSQMYLEANLPDDPAQLWEASPLANAHEIKVPTLIIHSENDYRCPIEQAEQLFTMLLRSGVETEMVRFPGESHELSRAGKPRHRQERFEAILDWHGRYLLPVDENLAN